jgi:SAM-dependent methyltransferase
VPVPERLTWAVGILDARPGDRVLEIGCGRGVALELLCARVQDRPGPARGLGAVTGLDRSPRAVEAAARRNAAPLATGRLTLRTAALEEADFPGGSFDKVLAVDVNLFWVRPAPGELAALSRWLAPGGRLCLAWQPPDAGRAPGIGETVATALEAHGFSPRVRTGTTTGGAALVCVTAEKPRG